MSPRIVNGAGGRRYVAPHAMITMLRCDDSICLFITVAAAADCWNDE